MVQTGKFVNEDAIHSFMEAVDEFSDDYRTCRPEEISEVVKVMNIPPSKDDKEVHKEMADRVVDGFAVTDEWVARSLHGGDPSSIFLYIRKPCSECGDRAVSTEEGKCKKCND